MINSSLSGTGMIYMSSFSGMMFHFRIADESGAKVIARMCTIIYDEEAKSRQSTFMAIYDKDTEGKR